MWQYLLFIGTLLLACALVMLVLVAPWLPASAEEHRLLHIFAQDSTVRRTTLASSLGLVVTAVVFFRPGVLRSKKQSSTTRRPPPSTLAGA